MNSHPLTTRGSVTTDALLFRIRQSRLFRNTAWLVLGFGLRAAIQALYFVLIARTLGPGAYGAFAAVVGLVSLAAPFSGLGMMNVMVRRVSRDRATLAEAWGATLLATVMSGALLLLGIVGISELAFPDRIPVGLTAMVCI